MVTVDSRSKSVGKQYCTLLLLGFAIGWTFKALTGIDSAESTIDIEAYSSLHAIRAEARPSSTNQSSYDMAFTQSFGFFDDIHEEEWKYRRQIAIDRSDHRRANFMTEAKKPFALWYLNNYEPFFSCPLERRVLGVGDGPKWVCDPDRIAKAAKRRNQGCLVYSVGSHGKTNFESGIHHLIPDCEIHIFDPGNYEKRIPARFRFHQWALTSSWVKDWVPMLSNRTLHNTMFLADERLKTFQQTVKALGHENRIIDILKVSLYMDIYIHRCPRLVWYCVLIGVPCLQD